MRTAAHDCGVMAPGRREERRAGIGTWVRVWAGEDRACPLLSVVAHRLKSMLNCQKADKASLLSEAVSRLNLLTQRCHSLETQLATIKGEAPPPPLPPVRARASAPPPSPLLSCSPPLTRVSVP